MNTIGSPCRYISFEGRGGKYLLDLRDRADVSIPLPDPSLGKQKKHFLKFPVPSVSSTGTNTRLNAQQILRGFPEIERAPDTIQPNHFPLRNTKQKQTSNSQSLGPDILDMTSGAPGRLRI